MLLRLAFNGSVHPWINKLILELNLLAPEIAATRWIHCALNEEPVHATTTLNWTRDVADKEILFTGGDAVNRTYFTTTKSRQLWAPK